MSIDDFEDMKTDQAFTRKRLTKPSLEKVFIAGLMK